MDLRQLLSMLKSEQRIKEEDDERQRKAEALSLGRSFGLGDLPYTMEDQLRDRAPQLFDTLRKDESRALRDQRRVEDPEYQPGWLEQYIMYQHMKAREQDNLEMKGFPGAT